MEERNGIGSGIKRCQNLHQYERPVEDKKREMERVETASWEEL